MEYGQGSTDSCRPVIQVERDLVFLARNKLTVFFYLTLPCPCIPENFDHCVLQATPGDFFPAHVWVKARRVIGEGSSVRSFLSCLNLSNWIVEVSSDRSFRYQGTSSTYCPKVQLLSFSPTTPYLPAINLLELKGDKPSQNRLPFFNIFHSSQETSIQKFLEIIL